jgi:single-stranded DNA-binding protein
MVQGELCMSSWEKDGKNFSKYFVRGKDLQFLSSGKKSDSDSQTSEVEESEDLVPF